MQDAYTIWPFPRTTGEHCYTLQHKNLRPSLHHLGLVRGQDMPPPALAPHHRRAPLQKPPLRIPLVHALEQRQNKRRRHNVQAGQAHHHGHAARIDRPEQRHAVGKPARLHVLQARVKCVEHGGDAAITHNLLAHVGVVLHVFEKVVFLALVE